MRLILQIVCLVFLLTLSKIETVDEYRLPKHIRPLNYKLNLTVNPADLHYSGSLEILLKVENGTAGILYIHADGDYIVISRAVKNDNDCNITRPNPNTQILTIKCQTEFQSEEKLFILYKGKFSTTEMNGLYKSTYDNGTLLVTTLLQPVFARRAFPCFDEPSFKATYELTIVHPRQYNVLANMPLEVTIDNRNLTISKFQKTPPMSTYLVAFIVSEFEPAIKGDDYQFNVFARPSANQNMGIATKYEERLFDAMSQWIGIRYEDLGNPQAYMAAIPDFSAGAMENWGLITFREVDLLDEGDRTGIVAFQVILQVMAHEIAHQWFGNYVTLDWWSHTWLNEGFATYFSFLIADQANDGDLELEKQFTAEEMQALLQKDATLSSQPISSPENTTNSLLESISKFDVLSYYKGAAIIRMMRYILGEDIFRKGLQTYLTENKYKNVNPQILLKSLQAAAGSQLENFDIKMQNWIYTPGFPLLTVEQTNGTIITITQQRFFSNKSINSGDQWYVPLSYTHEKEKNFSGNIKGWLEPNTAYEVTHNNEDWFILNIQQSGFYRVHYDSVLLNKIIRALHTSQERKSIDPLNRAQLIDDVFNIARIGKVHYRKSFELVTYLKEETSLYPWLSALREFEYLLNMVDDESYKLLTRFILDIITKAFSNNANYTTHIDKVKENLIYEWRCKLSEKNCISSVKKQFQAFKQNNRSLDLNKRDIVLCYGLKESDTIHKDFNIMLEMLKNSQSSTEQNSILVALGCIQHEELLTKYLYLTLQVNSPIRQQDFQTVFNAVYYHNKVGVKAALDFLEKNLNLMETAYGGGAIISTLLIDLAGKLSTKIEVNQMKRILNTYRNNQNVILSEPIVLEVISTNQYWKFEYGYEIKQVLRTLTSGQSNNSIDYLRSIYMSILVVLVSMCTLF